MDEQRKRYLLELAERASRGVDKVKIPSRKQIVYRTAAPETKFDPKGDDAMEQLWASRGATLRQRKPKERRVVDMEDMMTAKKLLPVDSGFFAAHSVVLTTENSYANLVDEFDEFLTRLGFHEHDPIDQEDFHDYLRCRVLVRHCNNTDDRAEALAEHIRSAICHYIKSGNWRNMKGIKWPSSQETIDFAASIKYGGGHGSIGETKGALTADLAQELRDFLRTADDKPEFNAHRVMESKPGKHANGRYQQAIPWRNMLKAFDLLFYSAMRIGELTTCTVKCWNSNTGYLQPAMDKGNRCSKKKARVTIRQRAIADPKAVAVLNELTQGRGAEEWLLPQHAEAQGHKWESVSVMIKKAAKLLNWDTRFPDLYFDGVHCLRHGGLQWRFSQLRESRPQLSHAQLRTELLQECNMESADNLDHYLRNNEQRAFEISSRRKARLKEETTAGRNGARACGNHFLTTGRTAIMEDRRRRDRDSD